MNRDLNTVSNEVWVCGPRCNLVGWRSKVVDLQVDRADIGSDG